ncbi:hypothetical protein, partial [Klebsiella michiganensis]|uniref:hypothetical protein n=1 Tax=Klebsiella michiganensis TaxID=1134687 RepID=UPI003009C087
ALSCWLTSRISMTMGLIPRLDKPLFSSQIICSTAGGTIHLFLLIAPVSAAGRSGHNLSDLRL